MKHYRRGLLFATITVGGCSSAKSSPQTVIEQVTKKPVSSEEENAEIEKIRYRYCAYIRFRDEICKDFRISKRIESKINSKSTKLSNPGSETN